MKKRRKRFKYYSQRDNRNSDTNLVTAAIQLHGDSDRNLYPFNLEAKFYDFIHGGN